VSVADRPLARGLSTRREAIDTEEGFDTEMQKAVKAYAENAPDPGPPVAFAVGAARRLTSGRFVYARASITGLTDLTPDERAEAAAYVIQSLSLWSQP
jgi:hypothetical protein